MARIQLLFIRGVMLVLQDGRMAGKQGLRDVRDVRGCINAVFVG
jgi:hypothetical protein